MLQLSDIFTDVVRGVKAKHADLEEAFPGIASNTTEVAKIVRARGVVCAERADSGQGSVPNVRERARGAALQRGSCDKCRLPRSRFCEIFATSLLTRCFLVAAWRLSSCCAVCQQRNDVPGQRGLRGEGSEGDAYQCEDWEGSEATGMGL